LAVGRADLVLVERPLLDAGDEELPHAACPEAPHRMASAIPGVEITDEVDVVRVRSPDGETCAGHPFVIHRMGAEILVDSRIVAAHQEGDPVRIQDW
jgi:hypothetical protein